MRVRVRMRSVSLQSEVTALWSGDHRYGYATFGSYHDPKYVFVRKSGHLSMNVSSPLEHERVV
jgi:hypothetical protein